MRKNNLTKAVETTVAPNPKEVDIWVEPKDDDTVSLKYYDYHADEWVGGSDGDSNDVRALEPGDILGHFYDGTAFTTYINVTKNEIIGYSGAGDYEKSSIIEHNTQRCVIYVPVGSVNANYTIERNSYDPITCTNADGVDSQLGLTKMVFDFLNYNVTHCITLDTGFEIIITSDEGWQ